MPYKPISQVVPFCWWQNSEFCLGAGTHSPITVLGIGLANRTPLHFQLVSHNATHSVSPANVRLKFCPQLGFNSINVMSLNEDVFFDCKLVVCWKSRACGWKQHCALLWTFPAQNIQLWPFLVLQGQHCVTKWLGDSWTIEYIADTVPYLHD